MDDQKTIASQPVGKQNWREDWRSWVTIILLLIPGTFLIGLIVMWLAAPWSLKAKWWVTFIVPILVVVGTILFLALVGLDLLSQLSS